MPDATPPSALLPARDRILHTAHRLFYRHGIRATGIDRVIAESQVAKKTFYRHFASKNVLILDYLEYRHQRWMSWFNDALQRHGGGVTALVPTLAEWLQDADFRGCAFINSVGELGDDLPEVMARCRRHKQAMTAVIAGLLAPCEPPRPTAQAIALAVDGAIVRAQCEPDPAGVLQALERILTALRPTPPSKPE